MDKISLGGSFVMSFEMMTKSASLPFSIEPFAPSSNSAYAASTV